jgi:NDP-sugar pyrophosphorylase family protein
LVSLRLDDGIPWADCGTPASYLAANLRWSGGESVIGAAAVVKGSVERCVVWPDAVVRRHEHLVDAIRADDRITVLVR